MTTYNIPHSESERILTKIVSEMTPEAIMSIPGVAEILSDYFNNDIIREWQEEQPDKDDDDE